ncbi:hypothetical protein CYY_003603 [Polysphondylium violaceum]|uniref:Peptidase S28 family protein n=1 Tax=Polysphondylium violaceum TaxID=133409 RepID=A0A8J4PW23_9MYCE|nr:hypothetical protein CYY_003603 [Polysphondylium violaceum]
MMMNRFLSALLVVCVISNSVQGLAFPKGAASDEVANSNPSNPLIFTQTLNHFDDEDTRTFSQRYFINDAYYNYAKGGPVILYINGEGPVTSAPSSSSDAVVIYAQALGACIVTLEHRYYGGSSPFDDLSTENLKFLNSRQALNDLAVFIVSFTNNLSNAGKVVTIGGSYSGALSAWFRIKYPHLTVGSIASSGVVNSILDFTAFDEWVAYAAGQECANALRAVTKAAESMIFQGGEYEAQVKQLFSAESLTDNGDFFYFLADSLSEGIQYGFHYELCNPLIEAMNSNGDILEVYSNYTHNVWSPMLGIPDEYATSWQQNTTVDFNKADRQWWFQTCSQLGWFQPAPENDPIRSTQVNMTYFQNHCEQVFGVAMWPNVENTNIYYGGNNTAGTNILYINGSQDPWSRASVISTLSPTQQSVTVTCMTCGHCVDLRGCPGGCPSPNNLDQVRQLSIDSIKSWLAAASN